MGMMLFRWQIISPLASPMRYRERVSHDAFRDGHGFAVATAAMGFADIEGGYTLHWHTG